LIPYSNARKSGEDGRLLEAQALNERNHAVLQFPRQDKYQVSASIEITSFNVSQTPPPPTAKGLSG
jgi:hypothetical protein